MTVLHSNDKNHDCMSKSNSSFIIHNNITSDFNADAIVENYDEVTELA